MKRSEKQGREGKVFPIKAEFQRIARRDKKAFFNELCLIIEENNKRGKIRDLFRRNGNIKGAFHPNMGTIKDKNGRDRVDTEDIKLRWKEYMEELYKTDLNEPDDYNDVVSHLECEVKWALRSTAINKGSGCDEIPAELFKSLKDDAIEVLHSLKSGRPSSGHRTGNGQSSSQFPRSVVPKNVLTIGQFCSSPMLVGWHHRLDGHEFEQAPGVMGREVWCAKESDKTEWLN